MNIKSFDALIGECMVCGIVDIMKRVGTEQPDQHEQQETSHEEHEEHETPQEEREEHSAPGQVMQQSNDKQVIQPDSGVDSFGKMNGSASKNITIKPSECGGIKVISPELNILLSKEVFETIKQFLQGENNG